MPGPWRHLAVVPSSVSLDPALSSAGPNSAKSGLHAPSAIEDTPNVTVWGYSALLGALISTCLIIHLPLSQTASEVKDLSGSSVFPRPQLQDGCEPALCVSTSHSILPGTEFWSEALSIPLVDEWQDSIVSPRFLFKGPNLLFYQSPRPPAPTPVTPFPVPLRIDVTRERVNTPEWHQLLGAGTLAAFTRLCKFFPHFPAPNIIVNCRPVLFGLLSVFKNGLVINASFKWREFN